MKLLLFLAFFASFMWPFNDFLQNNFGQFSKSTFLPAYQVALLCAAHAVLALAVLLVLGKRFPAQKNRLIAVFVLLSVLWFTFTPVLGLVGGAVSRLGFTTGGAAAYLVVSFVLIGATWYLARSALFLRSFAVAVIVASLFPLLDIVTSPQVTVSNASTPASPDIFVELPNPSGGSVKRPNIYYVVADGWMAPELFERAVSRSMEPMIAGLEAKGFYSASAARSNYLGSATSIGSLFHLGYFRTDQHTKSDIASSSFFPAIAYRPDPAPLVSALRELGYELFFSGTWYSNCTGPHFSCIRGDWWRLNRASALLLDRTPLKFATDRYSRLEVDAISRLDEDFVRERGASARPSFTFAHHMQPHSPWYFDDKCVPINPTEHGDQELYRFAVECLYRSIIALTDRVARLDPGAIIVVHGDHGWLFTGDSPAGIPEYLWPKQALEQRTRIANLIRLPEQCGRWLRPDLGPVNTMRLVVACAAGAEPKLLPETLYIPGPTYADDERFMVYDGLRP